MDTSSDSCVSARDLGDAKRPCRVPWERLSPVTAANPARVGETLIAMATGLGPTRPSLNPGTLFPQTPLAEINSPVEATLNGNPADVVNKVGWPGTPDAYRLDIRVPEGTAPGMAALKVTAAFIEGREVSIPIQ